MSFDLQVAGRTIWGEARGEGEAGQRAVAWVLRNRLRAGKWYSGKTLAETCMLKAQFSCWNSSDPNRTLMLRLPDDDPLLAACRKYAADAFAEGATDPTGGATHYFTDGITPPDWAASMKFIKKIGHHLFYRE